MVFLFTLGFILLVFCFLFKKIYLFKLEDNYNIVMGFAIHQHESAIGIHVSPPASIFFNPSIT